MDSTTELDRLKLKYKVMFYYLERMSYQMIENTNNTYKYMCHEFLNLSRELFDEVVKDSMENRFILRIDETDYYYYGKFMHKIQFKTLWQKIDEVRNTLTLQNFEGDEMIFECGSDSDIDNVLKE